MTARKPLGRPRHDPGRDLRSALLATSRTLLDEGGPAALSLREVARRAGCTHQAPYHYFEDRESLLAALVCEGFDDLGTRLRAANDLAAGGDLRATLIASAAAYVGFATSHPGVFRVMFSPDMCNPARFPAMVEAGGRARAELDRLNSIVNGAAANAAPATLLWAQVHGLSCLLVDASLGPAFAQASVREAHLRETSEAFADLVLRQDGAPQS